MTRDEIITEAYRKIGALGDYETASSTQLSIGATNLNAIMEHYNVHGLQPWKITIVSPTCASWTSAGKTVGDGSTIDTGAKAERLLYAYRVDDNDDRLELNIETRAEFYSHPSLETTGVPLSVYYQPLVSTGTVKIWPLPNADWADANHVIELHFQVAMDEFANGSATPDIPAVWNMALIFELACALAPNYGLPPNERNLMERQRIRFLQEALDFQNEEGSMFIRPKRM